MHLRTFTADTARQAIEQVRAELGPQAIIIAIDEAANGTGVIVRAALDGEVTNVERAAEEFRRYVIPFRDQVVALLGERDQGDSIRLDFDLQPGLIRDVTQRFAKGNIVQGHCDPRASWACDDRNGRDPGCVNGC